MNIAQVHYCFPKLPTTDIHKILTELGLPVPKEDLTNPTREFVTSLFEYLSEMCLGVNREEFSQPAFAGLQAINYPELHDESIPHMNSLRAILRMMEICQVHDFSIRDLINPDRNRFLRQLSGILNFARFREERLLLLNELNVTRKEALDTLHKVQEKHETMTNRLFLLKQQTQEETQMIQTLERDCSAFEHQIKDAKSNLELVETQIQQTSEDIVKQQHRIDEQTMSYQDLLSDQKHFATQIVNSPQKFRNQILEIGQILQHEHKDGKIAEKKVRELSAWIQNVEEAQVEVNAAYENLTEIREEVEKQKAMIVDLDGEKQSITTIRNELLLQQQNTQQLTRQINRQEEKVNSLRKQASVRGEERTHMMEELHQALMEAESFRVQVKGKAERIESEVNRVEKEVEAEHMVHTQELEDIKHTYAKLEKKVVMHLQSLQRALDGQTVTTARSNPTASFHSASNNCV